MSTYEKIASVLLAVFFVVIIILSYGEIQDSHDHETPKESPRMTSDFDESRGQDFKIGPFVTIVDTKISGGKEVGCMPLQPVVVTALHDIYQRLMEQATSLDVEGSWDTFEVNEPTLETLCNKEATTTLADTHGDQLVLEKAPFVRATQPGAGEEDTGTLVTINATVVRPGSPVAKRPTVQARVLIPDRFLDVASSTPR